MAIKQEIHPRPLLCRREASPSNTICVQIDLESSEDDIHEIQQEIQVLSTCASPYVTQYYGSFVKGFKLWIGESHTAVHFAGQS